MVLERKRVVATPMKAARERERERDMAICRGTLRAVEGMETSY